MSGDYAWWFLVVGLCGGAVLVWILRGQLARTEEDVSAAERAVEVAWISRAIEDAGGIAPVDLVDQVLTLHRSYLREAEPFEVVGPPVPEIPASSPDASVPGTTAPGSNAAAVDERRATGRA